MKIEIILLALSLFSVLFAPAISAGTEHDNIAARIAKVGSVCVQGEDCASATAVASADTGAAAAGPEVIYNNSCSSCHASGAAGAPLLGDKAQWEPRIAKGIDVLYGSVINGLAPGMPAKGLCFTCSDDDLRAVVDYMVSEVN